AVGGSQNFSCQLLNISRRDALVCLGRRKQAYVAAAKDLVIAERMRLAVERREITPEIRERLAAVARQLLLLDALRSEALDLSVQRRLRLLHIAARRQRNEEPHETRVESAFGVSVHGNRHLAFLDERAMQPRCVAVRQDAHEQLERRAPWIRPRQAVIRELHQ